MAHLIFGCVSEPIRDYQTWSELPFGGALTYCPD
jgi:hypothetical protein